MGFASSKPKLPIGHEQHTDATQTKEHKRPDRARYSLSPPRKCPYASSSSTVSDRYEGGHMYSPSASDESDNSPMPLYRSLSASTAGISPGRRRPKREPTSETQLGYSKRLRPKSRGQRKRSRHNPHKRAWKKGRQCSDPQYSPSLPKRSQHLKPRRRSKQLAKRNHSKNATTRPNKKRTNDRAKSRSPRKRKSKPKASPLYVLPSNSESAYSLPARKQKSLPRRSPSIVSTNNNSSTTRLASRYRLNSRRHHASPSDSDFDCFSIKKKRTNAKRRQPPKPPKPSKVTRKKTPIKPQKKASALKCESDSDAKRYKMPSKEVSENEEDEDDDDASSKCESSTKSKESAKRKPEQRRPFAEMVDKCISPFIFPASNTDKAPHRCLNPVGVNGNDECPCVRRLLLPLMKNFTKKGLPKKTAPAKRTRRKTEKDD